MEPQKKQKKIRGTWIVAAVAAATFGVYMWQPWSTKNVAVDPPSSSDQFGSSMEMYARANCADDQVNRFDLDSNLRSSGDSYVQNALKEDACLSMSDASQYVAERLPAIHASIDEWNGKLDDVAAKTDAFIREVSAAGSARQQLITLVHDSCVIESVSDTEYRYTYFTDASEATIKRVIERSKNQSPVMPSDENDPVPTEVVEEPKGSPTPELPIYGKMGELKTPYEVASAKYLELWGPAFQGVMVPELPNDFDLAVTKHCGAVGYSMPTATYAPPPPPPGYYTPSSPGYYHGCDGFHNRNPYAGRSC